LQRKNEESSLETERDNHGDKERERVKHKGGGLKRGLLDAIFLVVFLLFIVLIPFCRIDLGGRRLGLFGARATPIVRWSILK
jgi:hypothetical protein